MRHDLAIEQVEAMLRKINWVQEILNLAQEHTSDKQTADILSSISFIMDSATNDAEELHSLLR